eukprot:12094023-Alexandrium_andersonii.AAC.1
MTASVSLPAAGGPGSGPAGAARPAEATASFLAAAQPLSATLALRLSCQAVRCPLVGQTPSGLKRRP